MKVSTCENLDQGLVQWRNMAKIAKSLNLRIIHPAKFEAYMVFHVGHFTMYENNLLCVHYTSLVDKDVRNLYL